MSVVGGNLIEEDFETAQATDIESNSAADVEGWNPINKVMNDLCREDLLFKPVSSQISRILQEATLPLDELCSSERQRAYPLWPILDKKVLRRLVGQMQLVKDGMSVTGVQEGESRWEQRLTMFDHWRVCAAGVLGLGTLRTSEPMARRLGYLTRVLRSATDMEEAGKINRMMLHLWESVRVYMSFVQYRVWRQADVDE